MRFPRRYPPRNLHFLISPKSIPAIRGVENFRNKQAVRMGSSGSPKYVDMSTFATTKKKEIPAAIPATGIAFSYQPEVGSSDPGGGKPPQRAGGEDGILGFPEICEHVIVRDKIEK